MLGRCFRCRCGKTGCSQWLMSILAVMRSSMWLSLWWPCSACSFIMPSSLSTEAGESGLILLPSSTQRLLLHSIFLLVAIQSRNRYCFLTVEWVSIKILLYQLWIFDVCSILCWDRCINIDLNCGSGAHRFERRTPYGVYSVDTIYCTHDTTSTQVIVRERVIERAKHVKRLIHVPTEQRHLLLYTLAGRLNWH